MIFRFMLLVAAALFSITVRAGTQTALEAVKVLSGDYSGHWDLYGLDDSGNVKLVASWNDVISLKNTRVGNDPFLNQTRAFGDVEDAITYTYPSSIPSMKVLFTEGFKVNPDGTAGDHYFTYKSRTGQVVETIENQFGPTGWTYESPVDLKGYSSLGINATNLIYSKALTTKTIYTEASLEIQTISQTTTLVWRGTDGSIQIKEFVSMVGVHKRNLSTQ